MLRWLVVISWLLIPYAWAADSSTPGGKGSFNLQNECIETGRKLVPQVCADITFHYELSAFMGEPLAHYGLMWRLRSLTVQGGKVLGSDEVRNTFGTAADRIGLMLQGTAEVRQKNAKPLAIPSTTVFDNRMGYLVVDIDSGVTTQAGKMSWNVAGSPDWAKFFMQPGGGECVNGVGDVFTGTNAGRRDYVSSAIAKEVMKLGNLELSGRQICRKGTLVEGLESLEAAVSKACQSRGAQKKGMAEKSFAWCPDSEQPTTGGVQGQDKEIGPSTTAGNSGKTDKPDVSEGKSQNDAKQMASQVQNLERVEKQCKGDWSRISACYASQGCQPKSDEEIRQCETKACGNPPAKSVCDQPLSCRPGAVGLCFPIYCNGDMIPNPKFQEWESCVQRTNSCRVNESCSARCNPNQYASQADCVDKILGKSSPTGREIKPASPVVALSIKTSNHEQAVEDVDSQVVAATNEKKLAQQRALEESWQLEQESRISAMKLEHQKRLIQWCTAEPSRQSSCACGSVVPAKTNSPAKGGAAGCSK